MFLNDLNKEIKANKIRNSYILYGEDEGLIKETVEDIKKITSVNTDDIFSYIKIDGQKVEVNDLSDALYTLPFMTQMKVVEVVRADFFSYDKSIKNSDALINIITDFCNNPTDGIVLILYYVSSLEKKDTKLKALEKKIDTSKSAIIKMPIVKKQQVGDFLEEYFSEKNILVSKPVLAFIKDTFEGDIMQLKNDLDKIITFVGEKEITKEDVSKLLTKSSNKHKYDLLDLIMYGNSREALELYNELIYKRTEPQEILEGIGSRLREAFNYKAQLGLGKSDKDNMIALEERYSWLYEKKKTQYSKIPVSNLVTMFTRLVDTECRVKSTSTDVEREVELLILSVSGYIN